VAPTDYLWGRVARCHLALKDPRAALEALNKAESYAQPSPRLLGLRATCFRQLGESEGERQALLRAARTAPQDPQAFFTHVWPMVQDLTPLDGAGVAEILRESPDQTNNPHLLLFEAEGLIKSRRSDEARDRLERLDATQPPESVKAAADELKKRLPPAETEEKEP
jgi:tetratricopeptide (TPR) repeat protein